MVIPHLVHVLGLQLADGTNQSFGASLSTSGSYRSIFTVNPDSLPGTHFLQLSYDGKNLGTLSFSVISEEIPNWIKNNANWWSSDSISDEEFILGLEHLIDIGIISVNPSDGVGVEQEIPDWIKNNAKWWADNKIPDEDFVKSIQYLVNKGIIVI